MKVFAISECEFWAADTLETAKADYLHVTGLSVKEAFEDFEPYELNDEQLRKMIFVNDEGERTTFFEELERVNDSGTTDPVFFAGSDF